MIHSVKLLLTSPAMTQQNTVVQSQGGRYWLGLHSRDVCCALRALSIDPLTAKQKVNVIMPTEYS